MVELGWLEARVCIHTPPNAKQDWLAVSASVRLISSSPKLPAAIEALNRLRILSTLVSPPEAFTEPLAYEATAPQSTAPPALTPWGTGGLPVLGSVRHSPARLVPCQ